MNHFIITPFESVHTGSEIFHLDAGFDSINQEYGEASRILIDNIMRQTTEYRSACELVYRHQNDNNKRLSAIVCNQHTNPTLNGQPVFSTESIAAWKERYGYEESKHYITFPDLGICIGGMGSKKIPEGRLAIAFARSETEYYKMFVQV